ncbi:hypothetical protein BRADI_2g22596v3 [Brachypodium distachyon]|uniref:Knottin scorpion toxin-like domain-containing protein n=1 Tax=Brachypodium distachyon TaxID=15368 RepID=A0A0Q3G5Y0_BRADI|nr:hypothetical protein BRADI_2g22596v3 [Brachypodium distachyon]
MVLTRKEIVSVLILCLLLVHSGPVTYVLGNDDDCWIESPSFAWCKTAKCRTHCRDHGFVDGRCDWSFPNLGVCECRYPNCNRRVAAPAAAPDPSRD